PVTYAIKNTPTYKVTLKCENCRKEHAVEYSSGREVRIDHACPCCGVTGKLQITDDKK
ncbi:unnamed protein product, partial [marine sediment metagenome]